MLAVAGPEAEGGRLTVWSSTQVPFNVRTAIATALDVPEASIRVIAPDVGGGFGIKGHVYPEEVLIPALARRLGRPVKWIETRREHFLTASGDRDQVHTARIGLRRDGTIVAIETIFTRDHGAYPTLGGAMAATRSTIWWAYRALAHYHAHGANHLTFKTFAAASVAPAGREALRECSTACSIAPRVSGDGSGRASRRNLVRPRRCRLPPDSLPRRACDRR